MHKGDMDAKEKLVLHNLRLVIYIVFNKFYNVHVDFEELVSVGNIGLIKAINTFDILRELSFSTYAKTCIVNEILMFLRKVKHDSNLVSLDDPILTFNDRREFTYKELILDDFDIIEDYENKDISIIVNECITKLSDIERECIIMNFGLYGQEKIKQDDIAEKLNHTQSYVSRLISNAINKIKAELYLMGIIEGVKDFNVINLVDELESTFTIYQLLAPYTKEEIDNILSNLNEQEKLLIRLRYGDDLDNPIKSDFFTRKDRNVFYDVLIRKIRKMLSLNKNNKNSYQTNVMVKK